MFLRGIRGATTVEQNHAEEILSATSELLQAIVEANDFRPEDIGSVFITVTEDITATFPARAIRTTGWLGARPTDVFTWKFQLRTHCPNAFV